MCAGSTRPKLGPSDVRPAARWWGKFVSKCVYSGAVALLLILSAFESF